MPRHILAKKAQRFAGQLERTMLFLLFLYCFYCFLIQKARLDRGSAEALDKFVSTACFISAVSWTSVFYSRIDKKWNCAYRFSHAR